MFSRVMGVAAEFWEVASSMFAGRDSHLFDFPEIIYVVLCSFCSQQLQLALQFDILLRPFSHYHRRGSWHTLLTEHSE